MEFQVGVKIILQNKEGKFLLLQRNLEKYPEVKKNDSLDIVGGRIKIGTSLLENLKREIFEETKLELLKEPKLIAAQDILRSDKHVVRLTYLGKIDGEPVLDTERIVRMYGSLPTKLKIKKAWISISKRFSINSVSDIVSLWRNAEN